MSRRDTLHRLVDSLPAEDLPVAARLLDLLAASPGSFGTHPAAFDTPGARAYLGGVYTEAALVKRRERGQGPPYRRDEAGRVLYLSSDLDRFLESLPRG